MKLPLNELSVLEREDSFLGNEAWTDFIGLVETLGKKYDVRKVLFLKSDASKLNEEIYSLTNDNQRLLYKSFYSKYIERYTEECDYEQYICKSENDEEMCLLLSLAYNKSFPAISITYKNTYKCDVFQALLLNQKNKKRVLVDINNLHSGNINKYEDFFLTGIPSKDIDPIENPIWNKEKTEKFIATLPEIKTMDKGEQKAHLLTEGKKVARMNGWIEDENLSTINSKATGSMRCVFYPEKFHHSEKAFLSIDFEKRAFELHNHRGKHICEILYDGKVNTDSKEKHDIILKRK